LSGRPTRWRLLIDGPGDGAWNMAVDEAILESYSRNPPTSPTLRLYAWSPAALSLGRFQDGSEGIDRDYLRAEEIELVRRPTGGAAVLHDRERTYGVWGSLRREPFPGGVLDTYRALSDALCLGLRRLGLDAVAAAGEQRGRGGGTVCFAAPSAHEIGVGGRKLVGSAQLRRRGAFLQHGSILVGSDVARLCRCLSAAEAPRLTDLEQEGVRRTTAELDAALTAGFEERFEARLEPGELTVEERERATRLRAWKYRSAEWTVEGRVAAQGSAARA
jgi:lipoate-protein ligase A